MAARPSLEKAASVRARGTEPRHIPRERPGKPGGKRDLNRRQRTQALSDAALELFLQQGVQDVTIDEIVQRARIAKGSFYRYFNDKTDLVDAIFAPVAGAMRHAFEMCQRELESARTRQELIDAYERLAANLGVAVLEHVDVARLYLQECRAPAVGARKPICELAQEVTRYALELTYAARTHGLLKPVNPQVSALAVVGAVERLLFGFLSGESLGDPEQAASTLISLVLDGLVVKADTQSS